MESGSFLLVVIFAGFPPLSPFPLALDSLLEEGRRLAVAQMFHHYERRHFLVVQYVVATKRSTFSCLSVYTHTHPVLFVTKWLGKVKPFISILSRLFFLLCCHFGREETFFFVFFLQKADGQNQRVSACLDCVERSANRLIKNLKHWPTRAWSFGVLAPSSRPRPTH